MANPETGDSGPVDEHLRSPLERLRRELKWTRVLAVGVLLVSFLSIYGASRKLVASAFFIVWVVLVFLRFRWGIDDYEMSLRAAIAMTLVAAAVMGLVLLWSAH